MKKFLAILKKDTLLMVRDWPGLAILFIMPAVLLVIITFTQEGAIPSKKSGMKIALVDSDSSDFGQTLVRDLKSAGYFNFVTLTTDSEARESILYGSCQMALIVPDSATEKLFSTLNDSQADSAAIVFLYDPAVQKGIKDAVIMPVRSLIQLTAVKVLMSKYSPVFTEQLVAVNEEPAREDNMKFRPSLLQNNVPAFTLFAMFFIVIPLAGSIINEKTHGTFNRVRTLPVSYLEVVAAKIIMFLIVCILQFVFLMFIGNYIMPLLGEQSSLDLRVNIPSLLAALICSSLAAIGFGMMVGAFAATHGQAATFGSVMVVILALLGGIFVPVHMLPEVIRKISSVSPLRWGTDAFLGVFARYQGIEAIWPELCMLTGFFLISILLTLRIFKKH
jgi:ABC-2 type transport system permease protein